jgi:hypothetical protein
VRVTLFAAGGLRPSLRVRVLGIIAGALIAMWGALILTFFIIWRFLSPAGPWVALQALLVDTPTGGVDHAEQPECI